MLRVTRRRLREADARANPDDYVTWTLHQITLTDDDADAIALLAYDAFGVEPFYELARFRSSFIFPIRLRDTTQEYVDRLQREMRRITARVLMQHEPAFERVEQVAVHFAQGDTNASSDVDPRSER